MSLRSAPSRASAALLVLASLTPIAAAEPTSGAIEPLWTRYGTGLVSDLTTGDLDGDGKGEVVVGGRGVGALTSASVEAGRFDWVNKWQGSPAGMNDDDDQIAQEVVAADLNGDGAKEVIAGNSDAAFAMDGASGGTLWSAHGKASDNDFQAGAWQVAVTDLNGDQVPDVAFGDLIDDRVTAVDGRNGSRLWAYPRQGVVFDMATGDVNGDGFKDIIVIGEVDAGFEVHAISGLPVPQGSSPVALWVQKFPGIGLLPPPIAGGGVTDPRVVLVDQVMAGDTPEVVVAGSLSAIAVLEGRTGLVLRQWPVEGYLTDVVTANIDDDADRELISSTGVTRGEGPRNLQAFQPDGIGLPAWTLNAPESVWDLQVANLDADAQEEVVAAGGPREMGGEQELDGFAIGVEPRTGPVALEPATLWTSRVPEWTGQMAYGDVSGEPTIVLGGGDEGGVHGLDPRTGATEWFFRTAARVEEVRAADLDGDGLSEIIESGADSSLAVHDADGSLRWQARVPGQGGPDVKTTVVADVAARPGRELVAGTFEFDLSGPGGRIHTYSVDGERLWSRDLDGAVDELEIADLEGDGAADIVAVTSIEGQAARYRGNGEVVWEQPVETIIGATMALYDFNSDGTKDVIVGQKPWSGPGKLFALDGRDGEPIWERDTNAGINWIDATEEHGVLAGDLGGGLYRIGRQGEEIWFSAPAGGSSWDGEWTFDADRDGVPDVLSGQESGAVRVMSGADGTEILSGRTEVGRAFAVATIKGETGPRIAVGAFGASDQPFPSILVLDGASGERLGGAESRYFVMDVTGAQMDEDAQDELVAASGWQLYALDIS